MEGGQGEGKGGGVGRMLFVGLRSSRDIGIWCFCGPYGVAGEQGKNQLWAELGDQDVPGTGGLRHPGGLAVWVSPGSFQAPVSTCNLHHFSVALESQLALLTSSFWKITMTRFDFRTCPTEVKMEKVTLFIASSP